MKKELLLYDLKTLQTSYEEDGTLNYSFTTGNEYTEGIITPHGMAGIWVSDKAVEYVFDRKVIIPYGIKRPAFKDMWNDITQGESRIMDIHLDAVDREGPFRYNTPKEST